MLPLGTYESGVAELGNLAVFGVMHSLARPDWGPGKAIFRFVQVEFRGGWSGEGVISKKGRGYD